MVLPIVFVLAFLAWYRIGTVCTKNKRSLQNKIIGVGMFIWITTLYSLNAYQTLSAFDCTASSSGESSSTLDIDPEILCYSDETHFVIIAFSTMSFTFYTLILCVVIVVNAKIKCHHGWIVEIAHSTTAAGHATTAKIVIIANVMAGFTTNTITSVLTTSLW